MRYDVMGCPPLEMGAAQVRLTAPEVVGELDAVGDRTADASAAPVATAVLLYALEPIAFEAKIWYVQELPAPQPVSVKLNVADDGEAMVAYAPAPILRCKVYPLSALVLLDAGAAQLTSTAPSDVPGAAAKVCGAEGALAPTAVSVLLYAPWPMEVTAATRYEHDTPAPQVASV